MPILLILLGLACVGTGIKQLTGTTTKAPDKQPDAPPKEKAIVIDPTAPPA